MKKLLLVLLCVVAFALVIIDVFALPTFLVFLILKLTGKIAWAWYYVCVPAIAFVVSATLTKIIRAFVEAYKETIYGY